MSKFLYTYISILSVLFLTGIANVNANNAIDSCNSLGSTETFEITNQVSIADYSNGVYINSSKQENRDKLPFEIAEIEEIEEESNTKEVSVYLNSIADNFLNAQFSSDSFLELQKDFTYYKKHYKSFYTRLYIQFQVFII